MLANKKVVHILPDRKFVSQIDKFKTPGIENKIIFWGTGPKLPKSYDNITVYLSPKKQNISITVSECREANIVVVYSLLPAIILKLPKETAIIWRFFGYEIYEKKLNVVLSKDTFNIYKKIRRKDLLLSFLKSSILKFFPSLSSFNRALKRVNYFMGVVHEEYQYIQSLGFKVPPFIQTPINLPNIKYQEYSKKEIILLGNSRTFFNNHIDIINTLQKENISTDIKIKIPFSYGGSSFYTQVIKKEASKLPNIEFIEHFVSYSQYEKIYEEASAVIINSFRQMALGNITIALRTGTKIYLSQNNIIFHWLNNNGFKIFSTEKDLSYDLRNRNILLHKNDAINNFNQLLNLMNRYTINDFQSLIINI